MRVASLLLTVLPSPTRPLLSPTSLLHASCALGRRRFHPLQLCATQRQSTTDVSSAAAAAREHMIDKQNDVLRLECPTPPVLQQGLIETAQLPHICIAGESNAGKSSLINHLLNKKSLAKASSVAGKTKSVDMMLVNEQVVLTDLPGLPSRDHQVAAKWESSWRPLVFQYIRKCKQLRCMVYVHDVRWKVTSYVREFLEEVEENGLPILLVLSKDDRIVNILKDADRQTPEEERTNEIALRERMMTRIRRALGFDGVHLHYSTDSSKPASRMARRRLLRYIESVTQTASREETRELLESIAEDKFRPRLD